MNIKVETAIRKRKSHHFCSMWNPEYIQPGERCLVIENGGIAYLRRYATIPKHQAIPMLEKLLKELQ